MIFVDRKIVLKYGLERICWEDLFYPDESTADVNEVSSPNSQLRQMIDLSLVDDETQS